MQESYDTINLEYVEARKSSRLAKLTAITLSVIFTFTPMYEFITKLQGDIYANLYTGINTCIIVW